MKKAFNRVLKILNKMLYKLSGFCEKESFSLMFLGCTIVILMVSMFDLSFIGKFSIIISILFILYIICLYEVDKRTEEDKLPKVKKRLTFKDKDGNVCIDKGDWSKALIYLSEIENYIEKQGE